MNRLAVVTSCDQCPNNWWYVGLDCCCLLKDKQPCYEDKAVLIENENIPSWCPLPKTEEIDR